MAVVVDSHQHFWDLDEVEYSWLTSEYGPIFRTFRPDELVPQLKAAGVDRTVIVQAANSYADTDSMLAIAHSASFVAGVVGWVPLTRLHEAAQALDRYAADPYFRGVRHLNHEEADPDWLVQPTVLEGLTLLEQRGLTFDAVAVSPRHLESVPMLAEHAPMLKIVVDHLAKPPIKDGGWEPWATLMAKAASYPNVYGKVSGLNTAAEPATWTAEDLRPYIEFSIECFGCSRLMFGSDWPVAILAGDYQKVWDETTKVLAGLSNSERDAVLGGTAAEFYGLNL